MAWWRRGGPGLLDGEGIAAVEEAVQAADDVDAAWAAAAPLRAAIRRRVPSASGADSGESGTLRRLNRHMDEVLQAVSNLKQSTTSGHPDGIV